MHVANSNNCINFCFPLLPPSQTLKEALVMNFLSHVNINTAWLKKKIGQTLRDGNALLIVQPPNSAELDDPYF